MKTKRKEKEKIEKKRIEKDSARNQTRDLRYAGQYRYHQATYKLYY